MKRGVRIIGAALLALAALAMLAGDLLLASAATPQGPVIVADAPQSRSGAARPGDFNSLVPQG